MKYVGVSTPAWSFKKSGDPNIEKKKDEYQAPQGLEYNKFKNIQKGEEMIFERFPSYKIAEAEKAPFFGKIPDYPAPGHYYKEEEESVKKSEKKPRIRDENENQNPLFITKEKRFDSLKRLKNKGLGPGSYDPSYIFESSPKYEFGYKFDDDNIFKMGNELGPGHYTPNYSHKEFVKSVGICKIKDKSIEKTKNKNKTKKKTLIKNLSAPGPGYYDFKYPYEIPGFSNKKGTFALSKRPEINKLTGESPGPTAIENLMKLKETNSHKNLKYRKKELNKKKIKKAEDFQTPGPGSYLGDISVVKPGTLGVKFGTSTRPPLNGKTKKEIEQEIDHLNQIREKMRAEGRKFEDSDEELYEERNYNDYINYGKVPISFSKEKRIDINEKPDYTKTTPGPGAYIKIIGAEDWKKRKKKKKKRKRKRDEDESESEEKESKKNNGQYSYYQKPPQYSIQPRRKDFSSIYENNSPGPAAYDIRPNYDVKKGVGRSFTKAKRFQSLKPVRKDLKEKIMAHEDSGIFSKKSNTKEMPNLNKKRDPGLKKLRDLQKKEKEIQRKKKKDFVVPGPGAYDIKHTVPQLQPWMVKYNKVTPGKKMRLEDVYTSAQEGDSDVQENNQYGLESTDIHESNHLALESTDLKE